jgi:hypothetical protein
MLTLKREAARQIDVTLAAWDYRKVRAHLHRAGYVVSPARKPAS